MKDNKKIIGICLTKAEDEIRTDFLSYFYKISLENDCKLIVFNSPRDLYYGDSYDKGSKSVFELMNYDSLDAIVIMSETFFDRRVPDSIIDKAVEKGVPVILIRGEHESCCCIVPDYAEAYKDTIRHLFSCHGVKKPVFIGGVKDDPQTLLRLECFRSVLEENGAEFSEDMVYYGDYWDVPARLAVRSILSSPAGVPDAIVCANDIMAMAVCDELAENGLKVPDDVIVTGFDGLLIADYFMPRLTTCKEDIGELAKITMDIVNDAISGKIKRGTFTEKFIPYFSESCGCMNDNGINYRERARDLFRTSFDSRQHEGHIYKWVDSVLDSDSLNTLSLALRDYILPNSSVCLNESFIMTALSQTLTDRSKEAPANEYIVISSVTEDCTNGKQGRFPAADMVPGIENWLKSDTMCILTPIFVGEDTCGYYAVETSSVKNTTWKLFRVSKTMNIAFGALMNRIMKRKMQSSMINARFTDPLTGLPNLKGLTKWFDEFSANEENHKKTVMVSMYNIPQYKFIFENYGTDDIEEAVRFTADALRLANKDNGFIARTGNDEFIVFNFVEDESKVSFVINNAVSVFFGVIEGYNTNNDKDYFLEVNCGCTVAYAGWNSSLSSFIKLANAEMYINKLNAGMTPVLKDEKTVSKPTVKSPKDLYSEFNLLIEKNLFTYFFQPIIDAKTGDICAYEALMRTSGGIKMSPLEILDIAKEYNMLYEIEKATMFNVMARYERDIEKFGSAKVFINTIPGNFLKNSDLAELKNRFGKYISNFVFEITEQDTVTDDELNAIRSLGVVGNTDEFKGVEGGQIAVDDYGTGHSNIVNLLRYAPHIIKIDRFLISNIQNDPNKQMFVKSTLEFAKMNNIKVLAEGVETYDEMRTVIDYGVDLIQGYYTARPAEEPIGKIPDSIRNELIAENLLLSRYENDLLVYRPKNGETVKLYDLAINKYGCIHVMGGSITVVGTFGQVFETSIVVEPGADAYITLDNVSIKAMDEAAVRLDSGSKATICLKGTNSIQKNGILVPANASARIVGDGSLDISIRRNGGVGIGNFFDNNFGDLIFEHTGEITVELQTDKGVCVGGGNNYGNSSISFHSGKVSVLAQCVNSIGIGSFKGRPDISISENAVITAKCSGKNAVGIGSFDGDVQITSNGKIDIVSDGERCAAIGNIGTGYLDFTCTGGSVNAVVHSAKAVCIGSIEGKCSVNIAGGQVETYGEGDMVVGYGSMEGSGTTCITGGSAHVKILSGCIMQFGCDKCSTVITGGNVLAADEDDVIAINAYGEPLHSEHPGGSSYCTLITSKYGEYMYKAEKHQNDNDLVVYVP